MTEICVISDTHGNKKVLEYLKEVFLSSDMIIHLGDTSSDGRDLFCEYGSKVHVINGNCDFFEFGQDEEVIPVEEIKIFACHGHKFSVKGSRERLAAYAKNEGCQVALYGHTHTPREEVIDGVTLLNCGAAPKWGNKSYMLLYVDKKDIKSEIIHIS